MMSQEAIDNADDVIKISNTDFQYDATNKQIRNVTDPTSQAQDVATKAYTDSILTTNTTAVSNIATAQANAAAASASTAATSEIDTVANLLLQDT